MKKIHKRLSWLILIVFGCSFYFLKAQISGEGVKYLILIFSFIFASYWSSILTLHGSKYSKWLDEYIDKELNKKGTFILKSYLLVSIYSCLSFVVAMILFRIFANQRQDGSLTLDLPMIFSLDLNLLANSLLLGGVALNIFYMILILKALIDAIIAEARL